MKQFINETSLIAWKNFEATGIIGFYMLYNAINNPEKVKYRMVECEDENGLSNGL